MGVGVVVIQTAAPASGSLAEIALAISILSLLVAGASFGWNIYKEIGLRARVGVDLSIVTLISGYEDINPVFVMVHCVNRGPGKVKLDNLHFKFIKLLDQGKTKVGYAITAYDREHPNSSSLPVAIDVGETARFLVPFTADCFLKLDVTDFAVSDSFGRDHWIKKRQLQKARSEYVDTFVHGAGTE